MSGFHKALLAILGILILWAVLDRKSGPEVTNPPSATTPEPVRDPKLDAQRDNVYIIMKSLDSAARNPDSLKIDTALATEDGKAVCVQYRAQNGFGGMNRGNAVYVAGHSNVYVDADAALYNKLCKTATVDVSQWVHLYMQMRSVL